MELKPGELEEIEAANAALNAEFAARENGAPVILLVNGDKYGEVISKSAVAITLATHNSYLEVLTSVLDAEGYKPVKALRITKDNGTRAYIVTAKEGAPDVYSQGRFWPGTRIKK